MSTDLLSSVLEQARSGPELPAVRDLDRALTYGALVDEVATVAGGLHALGVTEGDRVALQLPNSVDFVVASLATLWLGALFVPLAVTDPEARTDVIVADCAPAVVITGEDPEDNDRPDRPPRLSWVRYSELKTRTSKLLPPPVSSSPERAAYAIYTSGTTASPKGVLISNRAFLAAVHSTAEALGLGRLTRTLCVSPFHFDGSFGTLFPTLFVGGAVVIRPREALLFPRTFFRTVQREGISYTGFSPTYLKLLLASPHMQELNSGTLEIIALGGEASALADIRALWDAVPRLRVFNRYGPTETTIAVTHVELTPELLADGTVPIGRPHPGVTFHIVDDRGLLVDSLGQTGELYIGGNQLMTGYWGAPELTREVIRADLIPGETVYRTGDLVFRNERGDYVYVDRADRVIKRFGVRISLLELADAMRGLSGVSDAACLVFDNDGEVGIAAFVVTDGSVSASELRPGAAGQLPDTMLPDRIDLVDQLPLTSSSKLDERRLLADAGLQVLATPAPQATVSQPG
ncbi:MAG TPA: amino acid adenylation domain-containing protein [Acidimicrobiales bacterium]|nr:amino acid adenylation domain-containing protein [Acidimicrobiales bacterium]